MNNLAGKLAAERKSTSDNLTIREDKSVKTDLVIKIIDIDKGIGVDKFTIQTEKVSF